MIVWAPSKDPCDRRQAARQGLPVGSGGDL